MPRPRSCLWLSMLIVASLIAASSKQASAGNAITLHSFNPTYPGWLPNGGVIADAEGTLYGETAEGGAHSSGTIFEFSPTKQGGWTQQILYSFTGGNDGAGPTGGLLFDSAGNLYGVTASAGAGNNGTVFELEHNPDGSWTEKTLHSIGSGQFSPDQSPLVFDSKGNLYGARSGGDNPGLIFEISPASNGEWKETLVQSFSFSGSAGYFPVGPLYVDQSGNIFGVTSQGGSGCPFGCGAIFELSPTGAGAWKESVIYSFTGSNDGEYPSGGLIPDGAGNLYGTTMEGGSGSVAGGTVFKLSPNGNGQWAKNILYNFQGNSDGEFPQYALSFDHTGNLFGVTNAGGGLGFCGSSGCGTAYELTPSGAQWSESVLWRFNNTADGYDLSSGVLVGSNGELFGEAYYGHDPGEHGLLFALSNPGGQWNLDTISGFAYSDGFDPYTSLVADAKGNLYGTTAYGGAAGLGAAFEMTQTGGGGWTEKMIYSVPTGGHTETGFNPTTLPSAIIVDAAGNLYGETEASGTRNVGMVYELSPGANGTWIEKTLYSLPGGPGGVAPIGGLIMDGAGNLYGTTQYGGKGTIGSQSQSGYGVVFEVSPGPNGVWTGKTLYQFEGYPADGANPQTSLALDSGGNLYGTTTAGGNSTYCVGNNLLPIGCGTAFELTPQSGAWHETLLHSFQGGSQDGLLPLSALVLDKSGNLFGTTQSGGPRLEGTVFELSRSSGGEWSETLIFDFWDSNNNGSPQGNLFIDDAGKLYGITYAGNAVFELSPTSSDGWDYQILGVTGGSLVAGVILGPNGYLYGTTSDAGTFNDGTVFALAPPQ